MLLSLLSSVVSSLSRSPLTKPAFEGLVTALVALDELYIGAIGWVRISVAVLFIVLILWSEMGHFCGLLYYLGCFECSSHIKCNPLKGNVNNIS
jgi:hypothetical protein